jgi:hypothetical protein
VSRIPRQTSEPAAVESRSLEARMDALAEVIADLALEVRGWRADQARRRTTSSRDERDALLLLVITQMFAADTFQAGEVIARASDSAVLRQALDAAGAVNAKKLGHCLERLERRDVDGAQIFRLGKNNKGIIWRVWG